MDKQLVIAKLESFGIAVKNGKVRKSDLEKVLSKYKLHADWQEGNLVDLGISPVSKNDQSEPVNYKEVNLLMVVGVDEQSGKYRFDIYAGNELLGANSGFGSAAEAMRAAEREINFAKV